MAADFSDRYQLFRQLAETAKLREGPAGVERILRALFNAYQQAQGTSLTERDVARMVRMPVPVVSAVRVELEKAGLVEPGGQLRLTPQAARTMEEVWGWKSTPQEVSHSPTGGLPDSTSTVICEGCGGTGITLRGRAWEQLLSMLRRHLGSPVGKGTEGQRVATPPETYLRAVGYMHRHGAVEGKHVIVLGSEVWVAGAVALAGKALSPTGKLALRVVAVHHDDRVLLRLRDIAVSEKVIVGLITRHLHHTLPEELHGQFDTVFVDLPNGLPELILYMSRAVNLAKSESGCIFLSVAHRSTIEQLSVQQVITDMGLAIEQFVPAFNHLPGRQVPTRDLYVLRITGETRPLIEGDYTEEARRDLQFAPSAHTTVKTYVCLTCGSQIPIGSEPGGQFPDFEALKAAGCPTCGDRNFTLLSERRMGGNGSGDQNEQS
jgi:predicted methyltransferase/DNA-directed RNA polymerase subunit RPC12/RpoP